MGSRRDETLPRAGAKIVEMTLGRTTVVPARRRLSLLEIAGPGTAHWLSTATHARRRRGIRDPAGVAMILFAAAKRQ